MKTGSGNISDIFFYNFFLVSDNSTGQHSLYTTFHGREIMFHVSTELPFTAHDRQQVSQRANPTINSIRLKFVKKTSMSDPVKRL